MTQEQEQATRIKENNLIEHITQNVNCSSNFKILKAKSSPGYNDNFAIVLCALPNNDVTPFVVWLWNGNDKAFYVGNYCRIMETALQSFNERN